MKRDIGGAGYLVGLFAVTGLVVTYAAWRNFPPWHGGSELLVFFTAIALELWKVDLFRYRGTDKSAVTAGIAATFFVLAMYGVEAAVLVALLQAVVTTLVHRSPWFKAIFNAGLFTTAIYIAGWIFRAFHGQTEGWELLGILGSFAAACVYFVIQAGGVSLAISLSTERSFRGIWADNFGWMVLQQAVTGMVGLLLGRFMHMGLTFVGALLLGLPLLLLRQSYNLVAARTQAYVGQIEYANAELATLNAELRATNDELIHTLGALLDARDGYTYGHSAQVATFSVAMGEILGMDVTELDRLRKAAFLHDIGKVGIPESILFKPGPLTAAEQRIMQTHAEIGYRVTNQIHSLAPMAAIIRQHHEWFGGGGYPLDLKGPQISLSARIVSVADALDSLISDRPYRKGRPAEAAFREIRRCVGSQFDPTVVDALEQLLRQKGGTWFHNAVRPTASGALAMEVAVAMDQTPEA